MEHGNLEGGARASEAPKETRSTSTQMRTMLLGMLAGIVGIVALGAIVVGIGAYKFGWSGPGTMFALRALPYPVASVNGKSIAFSEYLQANAALRHFYAAQSEIAGAQFPMPTDEQIRERVLDQLIMNVLLEQAAARYNITATGAEVDEAYAELVLASGGAAAVEDDLQRMYGWSPADFKRSVLYPYLLQEKLDLALAADPEIIARDNRELEEVLERARAGEDFADLARQYSSDTTTAVSGGLLGSFPRGLMVPEFEDAAFALEPGVVSDPVITHYGSHIILVHDREVEGGEVTEVTASHILIGAAPSERYLREAFTSAEVKRYVVNE